jgi:hypothetical protein
MENKKERLWKAVELHKQHPNRHSPPTTEAVPKTKPHWTYQDGDPGSNSWDPMISCLLAGMDKNSHKQVNYDKIKEITQIQMKTPPSFLTT